MIFVSISDINVIGHKFTESNIEVYFLGINSFKSFFKGLKKLNKIVQPLNKPILHCHMVHGLIIGVAHRIFYKKIPIIFTLHNILVEQAYRRFILFLTRPFRNADINFSKDSNKWYLNPVHVIANGVDFEKFVSKKNRSYQIEDKFIFLFLGRIDEQKNPLVLLDFVKKLIKRNITNFEIWIAGNGAMRKELEVAINQHQYHDFIKILGFQKDIRHLMHTSHCLILPSLWEGLPVSLIEASAAKLPIITTPVGSIPEYFNNQNSFVSDVNEFPILMETVITDYDSALLKAETLFKENRKIFDINSVYKKHMQLYKKYI